MDNNQLSFEAAKTIYNSSNNKEVLEALETVFPQLRKNEDEKIRKEILQFIKKRDISGCDYDYDKWIAWLEKQGEKLPVGFYYVNSEGKKFYSDTFKYGDLTLHVENQDEQKTDNKPEQKFAVNDWVVNKYGDIWHIDSLDKKNYQVSNKGRYNYFPIAKQDEMHLWTIEDAKPGDLLFISTKQRNYWAMFKEYDDNNKFIFFYCYICGDFNIGGFVPIDCINKINPLPFSPHSGRFYNTMKKAGYEWDDLNNKLVNINPDLQKFYTGDWVICTDQGGYEHIRQITNVETFTSAFDSKQSHRYWTSDITWFGDSYDARLWTLDDAKDGDVLATSAGAFIYNGNRSGSCPGCYCGINTLGKFQIGVKTHWTGKPVFPATKEQRDILFSKMKEADYEWDDEKKVLNKIPNTLEDCEIEHIEHGKYYYCIKDYYAGGNKRASKGDVVQALNGMHMMALGVKANEYFIPVKCIIDDRCVWSEEDKDMLENILGTYKTLEDMLDLSTEQDQDILTSMNFERVWLKSLKNKVILQPDMIEALHTEYEKGRADAITEIGIKSFWSEEDEDAIGMAIIALEDMYDEDAPNTTYGGYNLPFNKAAERLKSIKDRVQPKPMQEWKQENIEELTEFENAMMHIGGSFFGENAGLDPNDTDTIKEQAELLLELAPKQEWSEEDEEYINDLIGVFDGQQHQAHSDEEVVNWLKSIRLQCNKEWGKRDEEMLKSIIATCELACEDRDSSPARHLLKMQTNWLKSLRPQKQWKPSNEQIDALENLVRSYGESGTLSPYDNNTKQLYSLLYDLKNLNN